MKVLHINSYYSGSNFYKNLYDEQVKNGLDIDVFVPVHTSFEKKDFDYGNYTNLSANHLKYDRIIFHIKHWKIIKDIESSYKICDYSIIHAHSLFSNGYIAWRLKLKYNIPYIVAVRNTDINTFFKKMIHLRKMGVNILKNAKRIVFLSNSYKEELLRNYIPKHLREEINAKSEVIPNGIDNFWFDNLGVTNELTDKNTIRLLYVGVINKNKNLTTTVKAIKLLLNKGYKVKYTVVGKVEDRNIFNEIKDYDFLTYILPQTKEELINTYRENDIFVMPSIHETFGLVYAEALSQNLSLIYTKGQGFDGQFDDGVVGFKVDPTNEVDIAEKILRLKEVNFSNYKYAGKYKWDYLNKKYLEIYV